MESRPVVRKLVERIILSRMDPAGATVTDEYQLLDAGLIDSMGIFELVAGLEEECGVSIGDEELVPDNFCSIDAIVALVDGKSEISRN